MNIEQDIRTNLSRNRKDLNHILLQMKVKYCTICKSKLNYLGSGKYVCSSFGHEEIDDFGKIKIFLENNGPAPAHIISLATGVEAEIIDAFLRKGRVEITNDSSAFLKCEICGEDIRYGRICPICAREKVSKIQGYLIEDVGEPPIRNEKMRFLNRENELKRKKKRRLI